MLFRSQEQGGFSRSVPAHDGNGFPVGDAQGDAVQRRRRIGVAEAQVDGFYKFISENIEGQYPVCCQHVGTYAHLTFTVFEDRRFYEIFGLPKGQCKVTAL